MNDRSHPSRHHADHPPGDRLESWKRIAAYLNRDVRTLRRWERNEGMPVHRQMHHKLATVYAYKSELDAWRRNRAADETRHAQQPRRFLSRSFLLPFVLLAVVAGAAAYWYGSTSGTPELPFAKRDWVLITQFENRTGEGVFEGTLEHALERELSNSRFVNVVPRERITDALRLMKMPPDTRVGTEMGREIALRDGAVRALLTGRVEDFGGNYLLSASLVNPDNGVTVASFSRDAPGREAILTAVVDLAREVRETLGESLTGIRASERRLAKVATPSLEALQLYTMADQLMVQLQRSRALPLLQRAVEIDPDFASAHVLLSYILGDRGQQQQANQHLERAVQLAPDAPDRERYFILATYYMRLGDIRKAEQTLEILVRLYPDHAWAVSNLGVFNFRLNRPQRAARYRMRRADLRPNSLLSQIEGAKAAMLLRDDAAAAPYLQRSRELSTEYPWVKAQLQTLPVARLWLQRDFQGALRTLDELESSPAPAARTDLNYHIRGMYLALGKMRAYESLSPPRSNPDEQQALLHIDDSKTLNAFLDEVPNSFRAAILFARAGRLEEAQRAIDDPASKERVRGPFIIGPWRALARGELSLARGDVEAATPSLEKAVASMRFAPSPYYFLARQSLARAMSMHGDTHRAIALLEETATDLDGSIFFAGATLQWMRNWLRLVELYHQGGKDADARRVAAELRALLVVADADHPVLAALDRMEL